MKYFTFNLDSNEISILKDFFKNHFTSNNNEYILFTAKYENVIINAYFSGKVVLQGIFLSDTIKLIKNLIKKIDFSAIGSDEVGTGDVFGPVVVCSSYVDINDIDFLESLNIRDSKSIKDDYIIKIAPILMKKINYEYFILNNLKYNELIDKNYNLNKIKAILHNHVILKLNEKLKEKKVPVILDQFCEPMKYFEYLKNNKKIYAEIQFKTKAEKYHLSVAVSSIIARYIFISSLSKMEKEYQIFLPKGAGKIVNNQINLINQKYGKDIFLKIAKKNFKNITNLNL